VNTHWPLNTLITYETKNTDTHNSINAETGLFSAPFSGSYGFLFYARFLCASEGSYLNVDHNGARSKIYYCQTDSESLYSSSSSVYFTLSLNQGDAVGIFTGTAYVKLDLHPAKFTGFLLQKY
jgi:hypothetical protein